MHCSAPSHQVQPRARWKCSVPSCSHGQEGGGHGAANIDVYIKKNRPGKGRSKPSGKAASKSIGKVCKNYVL